MQFRFRGREILVGRLECVRDGPHRDPENIFPHFGAVTILRRPGVPSGIVRLFHSLHAASTVMRTIAVMNQKGGVGKTTTSVNLSAALARAGRRVCVVDVDPQGHASLHLGVEAIGETPTIYQVLAGKCSLLDARHMVADNLWVVPANIDLAAAEIELVDVPRRELILRHAVNQIADSNAFDYMIIDCPPSLGVLTVNALSAVQEVVIPLQPHFLALQGLSKLLETTALIARRLNRGLRVGGIVLCLYETGTRLAADVTDDLRDFLERSDGDTPWAEAQIFSSRIRRNIKLAEAPGFGQPIFDYAPKCPGSVDYQALADEFILAETQSAGDADSATPDVPQAA